MTLPVFKPLTIAGLMSGTSADGIDVALVRIGPRAPGPPSQIEALSLDFLVHQSFPFPATLRQAVLAAQDARQTSTAELARLHWRLGLAYAEAYKAMLATHPAQVDLIGCHGQTIYHQGTPAPYAGEAFACTWQIGEMAHLAREAAVPVYSDFRPADMAAGGQGAPLVPLLDLTLYRHPTRTRVLQNIGGIGNLTVVPPASSTAPVLALDTGPGNMVVDSLTRKLFDLPFDDGGAIAAAGRSIRPIVLEMQSHPFFAQEPPRSAGREQFGIEFASELLRQCEPYTKARADAVATATAVTAGSISLALRRFVFPAYGESGIDLIVSGGGAKNMTLMRWIREELDPRNVHVLTSDDPSLPTPLPVEAKEAAAFALLAYMSHHRRPGNVPTATGAHTAAVLGQVTCA